MSTFYRTFREQNTKNHSTGEEEFFCSPDPATTRSLKPHNYGKLQATGFVPEDTHVEPGDVIIGKCMPQKSGQMVSNKDTSVALKSNERGFIDRNCHGNRHFTTTTGDGYNFCKVRMRQERVPTIGDKVSCYTDDHDVLTERHGWVPIDEVDAAVHRVASLLDDGSLCYQAPAAVQAYLHRGEMIEVTGQGVDLLVTPDHRLWVSPDLMADAPDADMHAAFRARLAADVAAATYAGRSVYSTKVVLSSPLSAATLPFSKNAEAAYRALRCIGGWVAERAEMGGSASIALPDWMLSAGRMSADAIIAGAFHASLSISTRSRRLADQLQQLALHAGSCCDVADAALGGWRSVSLPYGRVSAVHARARAQREGTETRVFCCSVPRGPGVIYVRRGGCPVWCGNSRHGQKGTIGMLYHEKDMPFTSSGVVPSLIINPHAIPSRMTIGQLMEALECKAGALSGAMGDATPFNGRTVEDIAAELEALGAERYGNEIMYNPRSGEQVACTVFVCPTYYQRLKHMVEDKVHSRAANGPVVLLTRQPAEGRARDGGLRLGEMELECLWAHGSMYFLKVGGLPPPQTPPPWMPGMHGSVGMPGMHGSVGMPAMPCPHPHPHPIPFKGALHGVQRQLPHLRVPQVRHDGDRQPRAQHLPLPRVQEHHRVRRGPGALCEQAADARDSDHGHRYLHRHVPLRSLFFLEWVENVT